MKLSRPPVQPTMRVGSTTQRFFAEGEKHEAAEWQDTVLPPDDAPDVDPEVQFDSFDKIPKKRSPVITAAAIGGCLLIGSAAWAMAFGLLRTGHSVRESASALTNAGPSQPVATNTPATNTAENASNVTAPAGAAAQPLTGAIGQTPPDDNAPTTAPAAGPLVVPMAPSNSTPPTTPPTIAAPKVSGNSSASAPVPAVRPRAARAPAMSVIELSSTPAVLGEQPLPSENTLAAAGRGNAPTNEGTSRSPGEWAGAPGRPDRAPPLRGYVWSPSAKALVPAHPSALPTTDPDFASAAPSSPAPSSPQTGNVAPTNHPSSVPPEASAASAVAPAVEPHGVVAQPTLGAAPAERPAPTGSSGAQIVPPAFAPK
ncbi:MAG: hypothetical protein ABIS92_07095 [Polyangia bacterium]